MSKYVLKPGLFSAFLPSIGKLIANRVVEGEFDQFVPDILMKMEEVVAKAPAVEVVEQVVVPAVEVVEQPAAPVEQVVVQDAIEVVPEVVEPEQVVVEEQPQQLQTEQGPVQNTDVVALTDNEVQSVKQDSGKKRKNKG